MPREAAMQQKRNRPDKDGTHRGAFEKNKKKIYVTQTVCEMCIRDRVTATPEGSRVAPPIIYHDESDFE